ncbi:MAG: nitroreductase, partial [Gammaproteobacteria bacterium]|nr:nitroreductase [Gammaproteobacteria bacterium]
SESVAEALRLKPNEQMAGFLYIGTPDVRRKSIRGENLDALVQRWDG